MLTVLHAPPSGRRDEGAERRRSPGSHSRQDRIRLHTRQILFTVISLRSDRCETAMLRLRGGKTTPFPQGELCTVLAWATENFFSFVENSIGGGYVVALATICLLQYLSQVFRLSSSRQQMQQMSREISGLENQLGAIRRDRQMTRYENQILREFFSQSDCSRAIALMLRRLIPNPEEGFAAFYRFEENQFALDQHRGMSPQSQQRLILPTELREQVFVEKTVVLEGQPLHESVLWSGLSSHDRARTQQLYLLCVDYGDEFMGLFLTTSLLPPGAERKEQLELAERLMVSIGCTLKHRQNYEEQQAQLHLTSEMLQLRELSDRRYESPLKMIEEFVRQLAERCQASRAALILNTPESTATGQPMKVLVNVGDNLPAGVQPHAARHMELLAKAGLNGQEMLRLDQPGLEQAGVRSLFGSALVVPLVQPHATVGALVFARTSPDGFVPKAEALATWAADYLKDALFRAVSQAVTERQARIDGLTQLANRRTFDQQLLLEMTQSEQTNSPCALLLFDLDRFKSINDTYGHQAGDHVLRSTAAVLKDKISRIRSSDRALVARYGGEEMAILLPSVNFEGAMRIAESVRTGIESLKLEWEGTPLRVTTSVGVAVFPLHADDRDALLAAADAALYQAKANGRNRSVAAERMQSITRSGLIGTARS